MNTIEKDNKFIFILILVLIISVLKSCSYPTSSRQDLKVKVINKFLRNDVDTVEYEIFNPSADTIFLSLDTNNFYRENIDDNIMNFLEPTFEIQDENNITIYPSTTSFFPTEKFQDQMESFLIEKNNKEQKILAEDFDGQILNKDYLKNIYIENNLIMLLPKQKIRKKTPIYIHSYSRFNNLWLQYYVLEKKKKYYITIKINFINQSDQKTIETFDSTKCIQSQKVPIKIIETW